MKSQLISAIMLATPLLSVAQMPKEYKTATWFDFKKSAITYSFDDGTPNQMPIAVPILDKYGYKATFNLVIDWVKDWQPFADAAQNGHEMASHTISHPYFNKIDEQEQRRQLEKSKQIIEEKIGKPCITMVYPYCVRGNDNIVAEYYISARTCSGKSEQPTPNNLMDISSIICGPEGDAVTADDFNKAVAAAIPFNGWTTFLLHGVDNDGGYSPIKSEDFDAHLKFVSENSQDYWVATFAAATKYLLERNTLIIKEKKNSDGYLAEVSVGAESPLTCFDQPVTVSRQLPKKWTSAKVFDGRKEVPSRIENGTIIFNVVPHHNYLIKQ